MLAESSAETATESRQIRVPSAPRLATWLWFAIAGMMVAVQAPLLVAVSWPPREIVSDFFQDWASARNLLNGMPVYTEHTDTIPRYVGKVDPICYCNLINAHPPTSVLLFLPVAWLDYRPALLAWNAAGLIMLGASLWIVFRQLEISFPARSIFPALALLVFCRPLLQQLLHGQLNLILLLLVTGAWAAERSGRPGCAGALVGAAVAIKLFPGFLFLYFLVRRRWAALVAGVLTLAMLTALTTIVEGPDVYIGYFRDVVPRLETFRTSWFNASLVGFWTKLFYPATAQEHVEPLWRSAAVTHTGISVSWLVVVAAVSWGVRTAKTRTQLDHAFGAAVCGMLLLSPITWDYAFLLLLVPVAVLWVDPPRSEAAKLLLIACLAALWFWQKPVCHVVIPGGIASSLHTLTVLSYPCYSLLVLLAFGVSKTKPGLRSGVPMGAGRPA